MAIAKRLFLDRRILDWRTLEDVCAHARSKISSLGGALDLSHDRCRERSEPRHWIPVFLFLSSRLPADARSQAPRKRNSRSRSSAEHVQPGYAAHSGVEPEW